MTIVGQRGGTGKSVTAVNLAASFALLEKNTLLIDCDPQRSATHWCGIPDEDQNINICSVLSAKVKPKDAIYGTQLAYLDVLPSGFTLFQIAGKLSKHAENEKLLRLLLKDIETEYDYVIIDAPSSYSFLSAMAMTAGDWLLVCMNIVTSSAQDFYDLLRCVKYIRTLHQVPLKIAGLLFNRCEAEEEIQSFLEYRALSDAKELVLNTFIPSDENIPKSIDLRIPAALHDIKSPAAAAYLTLAKELHFFFS